MLEPSGNGHPASAKMEKGPHGKMPAGMKEAMKKMGANMDPEKAMEMAKSMGQPDPFWLRQPSSLPSCLWGHCARLLSVSLLPTLAE